MAEEKSGKKVIALNREARHEYFVVEALETGIELVGTEVKSLRAGGANLKDSWADIDDGELDVYKRQVLGVPQTLRYFEQMQARIVGFVASHSKITARRFTALMHNTGELVMDMGTCLLYTSRCV